MIVFDKVTIKYFEYFSFLLITHPRKETSQDLKMHTDGGCLGYQDTFA